ncbi:MAG: asparaginase domain-containing protein [Burkholderiales bacterium]|nr:asparaginase domain-containing protein [Burkholderiales bacterium]
MQNKKKILILYTGGTIGMDYTIDGLKPVVGLFNSQIQALDILRDVDISINEYEHLIDSSEINISHWQKIIIDIANNYDSFDGFVIIHGTDTMAYTASILSFALRGLDKPVILTGSQLPLVHRRSDGWNNVIDAVVAASQDDLHEVAIAFNSKLLRGCRAQKVSTYRFFGFDSVDEEPLAEFGIQINWFTKRWFKANNFNLTPILPKDIKVLDLSLRPGFTTEFIAHTLNNTKLDAVVLQTYGSGNIPMHNTILIEAIRSAIARGVIIVNITQVIEGRVSGDYASSCLNGLGIISGCDMTIEATLAKLTILLSSDISREKIKKLISKNLVGELTE